MVKNYVYRMDHDRGFAPHADKNLCFLSGCKKKTIEKWAQIGSWVIGIGGKNTGQSDKLIYVMEVDKNLTYTKFKKEYPDNYGYLNPKDAGTNVLVSKRFWYFGERAIALPKKLAHININRWGCKCVTDKDIESLVKHLESDPSFKIKGNPNNPVPIKTSKNC